MYFRFASAIVLVVLVALTSIELEKRVLEYRREIVRQHYQAEVLLERCARLRIETERMAAPARLLETVGPGRAIPRQSTAAGNDSLPLLLWHHQSPVAQ